MSRQPRRRRSRKLLLVEVPPATNARPLTPIERSRLHQRYASLTGRGVELGYASLGVMVRASTPDEMVAATHAAIVEATRGKAPSSEKTRP